MRILIYDINYTPELTGVGKYTGEMGAWLSGKGHSVEVITAMPYYPEWDIHKPYKGKIWFTEIIEGVTVFRCPLYVPKQVTSLKRILHEFSFVVSSLRYWLPIFFTKPYDVIICVSPPFHTGLIPSLYSRLRNVPLWLHLQDLQIDMAKELGMLNNKSFLNFLFNIEEFILKRSMTISTISEGMVLKAEKKKGIKSACVLFPNWVDETFIRPLSQSESLRTELGLSVDDKVVLYSGSLGEKQGLELIIEVANYFKNQPKVKFLISGSGGGQARLEALAQTNQLKNISFYPLQPYNKLSALLATADIHLVLQRKSASDLVLPSKLTSILASGGCALVSAIPGTTLYNIIEAHQMGILVEPESGKALYEGLNKALHADLSVYRQNARVYAQKHLSKASILQQFEKDLFRLLNN